ncbi:HypC/HybG/HupF family hydrogenase formation chaperone [Thermococci archaeon]|uniref:HypC/HybG/HupF family hydrogenase formation chaperone n=1 Tax=Palaeococcus sp. (in: euryarchaeotes) TaxID=2820298 RepID=UPI000F16D568|nr:HypC/HybG/HupF family hydrogenase formation chaperone [Palaeococcus sp. (in: euryarchaeotes)]MCD6559223.1 HypC/HybG/HupF family hydrogenase formation chaperone [Palaeococcus sp. (in: euryarchaeotes)]RLF78605.1 MAG: HypC/HybG/HupF family hydrogenase formation chaperone [Thermococci archaeon]RLF91042.1 MAG: HypC/HybG/HupF family hydrogenase formation chaperone [Thermococci archaeon]
MCLAVPAKVVEIKGNIAIVDFGGVRREARIDFLRDVKIGDYVIVHTGFAIEKMDEKAALESLKAWEEIMSVLEE